MNWSSGRIMKNEGEEDLLSSGKFTWRIDHFSKLTNTKHYSDVFFIGGYKWRILMFPKGNKEVEHLAVYLDVADASSLPSGWSRYANFSFTLVNQLDTNKSTRKDSSGHEFVATEKDWGFPLFIRLSELCNHDKGYLVNDTCVIEAEVSVHNVKGKILEDPETGRLIDLRSLGRIEKQYNGREPSAPPSEIGSFVDPSALKELTPTGQHLDFKGLGLIDKAFVPLLEEVCTWYPSLIACQQKRSRKVSECAFTALGELLYFLKTTKVKDMTEDACVCLQSLWEDVEIFRFDLAWLEPHVQTALRMKKFLERAGRVRRLREDVDILDSENKRRSAALAVTEADLEVAKRDLAKEEDGFVGTDMDRELGYGMP